MLIKLFKITWVIMLVCVVFSGVGVLACVMSDSVPSSVVSIPAIVCGSMLIANVVLVAILAREQP